MRKIPAIKAVMTPFPYSVEMDASLDEARAIMREHDIGHLPVTADHELVGVIAERDIEMSARSRPAPPDAAPLSVRDICHRDPYIVDLNTPLDGVLTVMAERHLDAVLVTRRGKLVGVFTMTDACREFGEHLREHFGPPEGNDAA